MKTVTKRSEAPSDRFAMTVNEFCFGLVRYCAVGFSAMVLAPGMFAGQVGVLSYDTPSYIEFSDVEYHASEGDAVARIAVVRTGDYRKRAVVEYRTSDGSAISGEDYGSVSGTLFFPAGQSVVVFEVPVIADSEVEGEERLGVELFNPGFDCVVVGGSATVVVQDVRQVERMASGPRLQIRVEGSEVVLGWPGGSGEWRVEGTGSVGGEWVPVGATASLVNGQFEVRHPMGDALQFYRLVQ